MDVLRRSVHALLFAAALAASPSASAQRADGGIAPAASSSDAFRALVDSDPFAAAAPLSEHEEVDPLSSRGTDDLASAPLPSEDELVPDALPIVRGATLAAASGVREVACRTRIELVSGLALVRTEIEFESVARNAAELVESLPVPPGAVPFALRVCSDAGCRAGVIDASAARLTAYDALLVARGPGGSGVLPIAQLERDGDARLVLRAAPIAPAALDASGLQAPGRLRVELGYAFAVPVHGGVARVELPARGEDARLAREAVTVLARDLVVPEARGVELSPADVVDRAPGEPLVLTARVPLTWSTRVEAWSSACEGEACTWVRGSSARPRARAEDVVIAIDASPSTMAGARGLLPEVALAAVRALPDGSRVRVAAFAARARYVVADWTQAPSITADVLAQAASLELGSSTRPEALMGLVLPTLRRGATLLWVGDGGITGSSAGRRAFEAARERGIELRVVSAGGRPIAAALAEEALRFGAPSLEVSAEALAATRGQASALDERVQSLFAAERPRRLVVRGLGEARERWLEPGGAFAFAARGRLRPRIDASGSSVRVERAEGDLALAIAAVGREATRLVAATAPLALLACSEGERVLHGSASLERVTRLPNRFAIVERRTCHAPSVASASGAARQLATLSATSLHRELTQRVMPRVRECFRDDRRGRASYSTRLRVTLTLADREIADVRVDGPIPEALAACVAAAVDGLDVPPFDGAIVASWPLYSRPDVDPPTLELHPDVASSIDQTFPREAP